jgi:hypothetical protein
MTYSKAEMSAVSRVINVNKPYKKSLLFPLTAC